MLDLGYREQKEELIDLYDRGQLAHTLLIHGPEGSGALAMVLDVARHMLDKQPAQNTLFGESPSSQTHDTPWKMEHPDFHVSFPFISMKPGSKSVCDDFVRDWRSFVLEHPFANDIDWLHHQADTSGSKAKNPKGNINTAECQNILRKLSLKPFGNNPKVVLIWYPEYLGKEGNRLLKTLEEPTDDTYIFLVAENTQLVLNTILSRCQSIMLRPWTDQQISEVLSRKFPQLSEDFRQNVLYRSGGNVRAALQLASKTENAKTAFVLEWLRVVFRNDTTRIASMAAEFDRESRDTQAEMIHASLHFLRQVLLCGMDEGFRPKLEAKEAEAARKMTSVLKLEGIEAMKEILEQMIVEIYRNASAKILFVDMSFQMYLVMHRQQRPVFV